MKSLRSLPSLTLSLLGVLGCSSTPAMQTSVDASTIADVARDAGQPSADAPMSTDVATTDIAPGSDVPGADVSATDLGAVTCDAGAAVADPGCSYTYSAFNSSASVMAMSTAAWSCSATLRTVTGNGIPDHPTGTFPNANCPNTISAYAVNGTMTLSPVNTGTASSLGIGGVGYALNSVKFDPGTAGTCSTSGTGTTCSLIGDTGTWNIEALGQTSFNFGVDSYNAHVQPTGEYHYHGMPLSYLATMPTAPKLVGYALDGFPIYARYGYSTATNACSPLRAMVSSWRLKATPDAGRPSTTTYPMGAFTQDYEYVAGLGDLDQCNGRFDVTPEHPAGIYHYYITDTWPFIQRCVMGTAMGGMPPADGGTMTATDAGMMARACSSPSDCTGACPAAAHGCTCGSTPMGMMCVPTCSTASDCPPGPMGMTLTCTSGICVP